MTDKNSNMILCGGRQSEAFLNSRAPYATILL